VTQLGLRDAVFTLSTPEQHNSLISVVSSNITQFYSIEVEFVVAFVSCSTVTIEQLALIKHCLWMTKMVTHSKIVDPLYILHENMPF
jgi:hypothetical protein